MTDYYIPLAEITGSLGLGNLPGFGDEIRQLLSLIGVRSWHESWNDTDTVVTGTGVLSQGEFVKDLGAFQLALGDPSNGSTEFDFELVRDRSSLLETALALAGEVDDVSTLDDKLQVFFRSDGPPRYMRLVIRGLGLRIRLDPDRVRKGKLVVSPDGKKTIERLEGEDDTADILVLPPAIIFDTRLPIGFDIGLQDDQLVEVPPLRILSGGDPEETALCNLLVKKVKFDLSEGKGLPEALQRGYDESWRGLYFEELAVLGLEELFPLLPSTIDATHWFIGTDGITGALSVTLAGGMFLFKDLTFEMELDKDRLVRAGGQLTLLVSTIGKNNEFASLGPDGDVLFGFSMRFHPGGGTLLEGVLRTPHPPDPNNDIGLLTLKDGVADVFPMLLLILGLSAGLPEEANIALWVLHLLTMFRAFDFKALTLDALAVRRRAAPLAGRTIYWLDFVLDVKVKVGLNIPLSTFHLPDIKTKPDQPVTLVCRGFTFAVALNLDDFTDEELDGTGRFDVFFDTKSDLSFEVGDEAILDNSPLVLVKVAIGRWDQGLWFDIGTRMSKDFGNFAFSVLPSLMRFWFRNDGSLHDVTVQGASFSVLVPQTIYARGEWQSGEVTRTVGKAMVLGWAESAVHPEEPKNWMLVAGFAMVERDLPPPPAPKEATSRLVGFDLESSSGIPLGCTSLYGISGLYAQHARPAIGSGTPAQWLTERNPKYQVGVDKWEPALNEDGLAAGVVIGASSDQGRPWNLKAGFLYARPGPVLMLFGTLNLLKERRGVKETQAAAFTFNAVIDLLRKQYLLGFRCDYRNPEPSARLTKITVPAELFSSEERWHVYLGMDKPADRMVKAELFAKYTVAGYAMYDTGAIANLAETGVDVPGTALAVGFRFDMEGGRKGSRYKLVYFLKVAADVAMSFSEPGLILFRARVAGGLVAKAWGIGFEFELSAEFFWVKPTPDYLKGILKVTLDLPWPVPNLSLKIELTKGADGEGEPITGSLVDGLSLFLVADQRVVEVTGPVSDVPINPIFSLAFKYPTRNGAAVPGSFNLSGANASTFFFVGGVTGEERGYAVTLEGLSLYKVVGGVGTLVSGPFPALWRPTAVPAAGGQPDTRILELFAYDGITASRYIGASADYVDWATTGFDPCPPKDSPTAVCYRFDGEELGAIQRDLSVAAAGLAGDGRRLRVANFEEEPDAELLRRFLGSNASPADVVPCPVPTLGERVIRLASNDGADPPVLAAGALELTFDKTDTAEVTVLRFPRALVRATGWFGERLVADEQAGQVLGIVGDRYELVKYVLKGPLNRVQLEAANQFVFAEFRSMVLEVCLLYEADLVRWNDQDLFALSWSNFWSDLLTQDAAASSALLLEPASEYRLEVQTSWAHRHDDGTLGTAHPDTVNFTFITTADPPAALRGPTAALDPSDWEVRTMPAHGDRGVYAERPIRLEFRDARTDKVFGAFGRRLILRLTDENGEDLFDRLELIRENATDLPEYQHAWKDKVLGQACAPPDLDSLWSMGSAHFPSVLVPDRRYDGTLVMLPNTITDLTTVEDWEQYPVLYRFAFTTSRYPSLAQHVAGHRIVDEVCAGPPQLVEARSAIGPQLSGGHRIDGPLLESILESFLSLVPRPSPPTPEVVRIWTPSSQFAVVGLLVDGPEPLVKRPSDAFSVSRAGAPVPVVRLDREDGCRTLLLFEPGATLAGSLTVTLSTSFIGGGGTPQSDVASLVVLVSEIPEPFAAEHAP